MKQVIIVIIIFSCAIGIITVALKQASSVVDTESLLGIDIGRDDSDSQSIQSFELFVSTDKGQEFETTRHFSANPDLHSKSRFSHQVNDIEYFVDFYGNSIVLIATNNGIFASTDQGIQWEEVFQEYIRGPVYDIAIDDTTRVASLVVAGTNRNGEGAIFVSSTGGSSFIESFASAQRDDPVRSVVYDVYNKHTVYAITKNGLFLQSIDSGNSWDSQQATAIGGVVDTMVLYPHRRGRSTTLFVVADDGLYRSTTSGEVWQSLNASLLSYPGGTTIHDVHISEEFSPLYIGTDYGLLVSNDFGNSFQQVSFLVPYGTEPVTAVAIHPRDSATLYAGIGKKVYVTENAGQSWRVHTVPNSTDTMDLIFVNPFNSSVILIASSRNV